MRLVIINPSWGKWNSSDVSGDNGWNDNAVFNMHPRQTDESFSVKGITAYLAECTRRIPCVQFRGNNFCSRPLVLPGDMISH
jgi:hypothetical protein